MENCPRCKHLNSIIIYTKIKYYHLNKVSVFAYSLKKYIQCDYCNSFISLNELSVQGESFASLFFSKQKISWTYFMFFIALFVGLFLSIFVFLIKEITH